MDSHAFDEVVWHADDHNALVVLFGDAAFAVAFAVGGPVHLALLPVVV